MITVEDASLVGFGELFTRAYQTQKGLLPLGNTTDLKISHTEEEKKLPNFSTGVGNRNSFGRITGVTCSFTMYDVNARNLALMGRGTIKGVAAAPVVDELHTCEAVPGELIPFNALPDMSVTVTVKTAGDVELAPGTDYILTPYGIQLTSGTTATAAGVKVSYTSLKANVVQMLTTAQVELEVYFAGLNAAQGGAPTPARLRRFKVGLVQEIALSGSDYAAYNLTGELLADPLIVASDMSQFYELGDAAKAV
ncbi:hypothetical protein ACQKFS_02560 [Pseudomonas guineae]|uniref:phage tail tube protein n=1 Tax=Pseudomonas guineae TaxID=425504 RepID=UPI003D0354E3